MELDEVPIGKRSIETICSGTVHTDEVKSTITQVRTFQIVLKTVRKLKKDDVIKAITQNIKYNIFRPGKESHKNGFYFFLI